MAIGRGKGMKNEANDTKKKTESTKEVIENSKPAPDWDNSENQTKPTETPIVETPATPQVTFIKVDEVDRLKLGKAVLEHQLLVKDLDAIKKEFEYKNRDIQYKVQTIQDAVQILTQKYNVPIGWGFDMESFTFIPEDQISDNK